MFGDLPKLITCEDGSRSLGSNPETRGHLLGPLSEQGYNALVLMGIRNAINTQDSDINDVLARIAYSANMITTENRALLARRRIEDAPDRK